MKLLISKSSVSSLVASIFLAVGTVSCGEEKAAKKPEVASVFPTKKIESFLATHCYECHDDVTDEGGLNLLDLDFKPGDHANFETWVRVFDRVRENEMPPKKVKERPAPQPKSEFLAALKKPLVEADLAEKKSEGRVNVRRLTRREYEHTIHDLIGIDMPLQDFLPEDPVSHGFETVATVQQLSHHQLARYLEVADLVLNDAFKRAQAPKEVEFSRTVGPQQQTKKSPGNYRGPELRNGEAISWRIEQQFYGRMPATTVPADGWYRVTLKNVRAINPKKRGTVWGTLRSGACYSNAPILYPVGLVEATAKARDITFETWIRKDHMLELKPNDVTLKRAPTGASGGNVSYQNRNLAQQGFAGIANKGIVIERIFPNAERWRLRLNLYPGISKEDSQLAKNDVDERNRILKRTIKNFASRAFRRPVTAEQVEPYFQLALGKFESDSEARMHHALQAAYRAVLCSPRFLTFVEKPGKLDDHALASRLSYALTCSMPDKKLRQLADEGKLRDPKIFHDELKRLIESPKFDRFVVSFTDQWLNLKEINFTAPDRQRFRTFDDTVQASMLEETRAFFREMIRTNRPVTHMIDSNFAMMNGRLATFYNMDRLKIEPGKGTQQVWLGDYPRGGLVTQGAILKVTANGTTTSPVMRGVFVSERILGLEIPPPPDDIPAVEPDIRGAVSIRDQLEKHKNQESCASCHVKIDPAGFALENFDPVGLWRTKYGSKKDSAKVDPSGVTPDGVKFPGIQTWKKIYVKRPEELTEAFARQLLTYATGAPIRFSDRANIDNIVKRAGGEKAYKMRSIFHAALGSEIFRTK